MDCSESKKAIMLYTELSPQEQEQLDVHLKTCAACFKFFQETQQFEKLIQQASAHQPIPKNASATTGRIMSGIQVTDTSQRGGLLWNFMGGIFMRYSLACISVFLIVFFMMELMGNSAVYEGSQPKEMVGTETTIILEAGALRENFQKRASKRPLFISKCISSAAGKIDFNCLKSKVKSLNN